MFFIATLEVFILEDNIVIKGNKTFFVTFYHYIVFQNKNNI
ncbi:MAG: septum site-determining protein MinC, partial [Clostridium sp.]|nr:septum site-determining protein MinC [Clostridium sp.]